VCLFYFGIAVIGFALGVVAGLSLLPFIHISYVEDHSWLPIVIVVVLGVIGAIIALMIQKPLIILSTSLLGQSCHPFMCICPASSYICFQYRWISDCNGIGLLC
jgi:hypothetical protein